MAGEVLQLTDTFHPDNSSVSAAEASIQTVTADAVRLQSPAENARDSRAAVVASCPTG